MDDDSTTYPNSRVAELPTSDAAAPPLGELPDGPPAQARAQHPPKPVHLIDPGDVGGIGQQEVAPRSEGQTQGPAGGRSAQGE